MLNKLLTKAIMKTAVDAAYTDTTPTTGDVVITPSSAGFVNEPKAPASLLEKMSQKN
ncbi:hypothetical protein [Paenibacillus cremeus]|uniref:hypothetical protein n=1 Tax=Paenibacillus cremeus TaxID=2163881 RepID=UPI0016483196|nr:hypothetical protein [Paenibacillus cremeus]